MKVFWVGVTYRCHWRNVFVASYRVEGLFVEFEEVRLGLVMLMNISQREEYEVCFRNYCVLKSQLKKELQL